MFLGTSRIWWILSGVLLLAGFVLMALGQTLFGILALFAAIGSFAAAPMRYGENARLTRQERRAKESAAADAAVAAKAPPAETPFANLPPPPPLPPRERPPIAGRDASEV